MVDGRSNPPYTIDTATKRAGMQTLRNTQAHQLAGQTKLTAVRIYTRGKTHTMFMHLLHDSKGAAILPQLVLDKLLEKMGVQRGQTYSVG
jgi:hypothetical protein